MTSWLFLLVCVIGAALVWNVFRPIRAGARLSAVSFFLGWLTGELALHHILWQGIATAVFVALGALDAWPGRLGLGIAGVSWIALLFHTLRGFEAGRVVERALSDGIGPEVAARTDTARHRLPASNLEWRTLLAPFPIRHPGVERIRNIRYGRASAIDLYLDIYRPLDAPDSPRPIFLYVHGGGWMIGTKDTQGLPLMGYLASRGWVCVNVNYRLSPHATFPDHLVDLKRAVAWLRAHGAEYGADPAFVAVAGGSAGGHLAALLALTADDPEYQPGFEDADTRVQACVPIYGVYDFAHPGSTWHHDRLLPTLERHIMKTTLAEDPKAFEKASPLHRIGSDAPAFFVVHGAADTLVPPEEARVFVAALRERSRSPVVYAEIPGAQHAFELFPSIRSQLVRGGIERFLGYVRNQARGGSHASAAASQSA
ncbi:alpha/beta hydrolase [Myxococcota bacterium]|nr:alpha/beta hydrolase [Myxococcota bacterium]MCZ7617487.1 alpha/beta hydrolase [Myxococcota bacterium]